MFPTFNTLYILNKVSQCALNPAEETAQIARFCNNNMDLLSFPHQSIEYMVCGIISVLYNDRTIF